MGFACLIVMTPVLYPSWVALLRSLLNKNFVVFCIRPVLKGLLNKNGRVTELAREIAGMIFCCLSKSNLKPTSEDCMPVLEGIVFSFSFTSRPLNRSSRFLHTPSLNKTFARPNVVLSASCCKKKTIFQLQVSFFNSVSAICLIWPVGIDYRFFLRIEYGGKK